MTKPTMKLSEVITKLQKLADELPFDPNVGKHSPSSIYPEGALGIEWARDWNTVIIDFDDHSEED